MSAVAVQETPTTPTARTSAPRRIPMTRVVGVELRKMFDTRSGFWMLASIGITALIATGAVIAWAPDAELTYDTFAAAIGIPMTVILPMIAILSVTSEWSQRSGLTTFTLVPHRGRVFAAKATAVVLVGVASMALAFAIGALGNVVGTSIAGTSLVWDISLGHVAQILLGNVLGMLLGFGLGVLVRNSAGAMVGYLVYAFVIPPLAGLLAMTQQWFADLQAWVDFSFAQGFLFNGIAEGERWAQLGTASGLWILLPLVVGLRLVLRSEVK
jgi:hypothetical protein